MTSSLKRPLFKCDFLIDLVYFITSNFHGLSIFCHLCSQNCCFQKFIPSFTLTPQIKLDKYKVRIKYTLYINIEKMLQQKLQSKKANSETLVDFFILLLLETTCRIWYK